MPRVARAVALALLAIFVLAPLTTAGAPELGGPINAAGTARAQILGGPGPAFEGGAFEWSMVCEGCFVKVTFDSGTITVVQQGQTLVLPPGSYEFRDYYGFYGWQGSFAEFHGEGKLVSTTAP